MNVKECLHDGINKSIYRKFLLFFLMVFSSFFSSGCQELTSLQRSSSIVNSNKNEGQKIINGEKSQSSLENNTLSTDQVWPIKYTVTIPKDIWGVAKVSCSITTNHPLVLHMNNNGSPDQGYAFFIQQMEAVDINGNEVPIDIEGENFKINVARPITLNYEVLLLHNKFKLPYGQDEAPYITKDGVFWTGRSLFIITKMKDISIYFNLPNKCHVSTPWQPNPNKKDSFFVENENQLTDAFIFVGNHIEAKVQVDSTETLLALGNEFKQSKDILQETVQKLLSAYSNLYGGSVPSKTLIVINHQDKKGRLDGGVFGRSVSMLVGDEPNKENIYNWSPFIAHELFHIWNGQAIAHTGQESWFSEGFTDYYATIVCARTGLIDEQGFIQRQKRACEYYFSMSGQIPLRQAKEYALQYAGGSLVAACLDVRMRECTKNTTCLDDLMRQMYLQFGQTDKKYDINDINKIVNRITGENFNAFFKKYVMGIEELPLEECFACIGFDFKKEVGEELPNRDYVIHKLLRINSLRSTSGRLIVQRSQDAGYQDGDSLISIAGTPVKTFENIQKMAKILSPGETVGLILQRDGRETAMNLCIGGKGEPVILERKVNVIINKKQKLDGNQKMVLSGIINGSGGK